MYESFVSSTQIIHFVSLPPKAGALYFCGSAGVRRLPATTAQIPEDCFLKWKAGLIIKQVEGRMSEEGKDLLGDTFETEEMGQKRRVWNPPTKYVTRRWY